MNFITNLNFKLDPFGSISCYSEDLGPVAYYITPPYIFDPDDDPDEGPQQRSWPVGEVSWRKGEYAFAINRIAVAKKGHGKFEVRVIMKNGEEIVRTSPPLSSGDVYRMFLKPEPEEEGDLLEII